MNEEIVFAMGLDVTGFGVGKRKIDSMMDEMKKSGKDVGEILKKALEIGGVTLSLAAFVEASKRVMEYGEHLRSTAEQAGVTAEFLQQVSYGAERTGHSAEDAEGGLEKLAIKIGEAREGSAEAVAAFQKWGITLKDASGAGLSVQDIAEQIGKKMEGISDPTLRDALAFDLLGKSGAKLVATLSELDKFKAESKNKIISDNELAELESANQKLKEGGRAAETFGAKLLAAFAVTFGLANPNAGLDKFVANLPKGDGSGPKTPDVTTTKEYAAALKEMHKAEQDARANSGGGLKLAILMGERDEIQKQIDAVRDLNDGHDHTIDLIKLQTDLSRKNGEIDKERNDINKKFADDQKKAQDEQARKLEHEKELTHEISESRIRLGHAERELQEKKDSRSQLTIAELTNSRFNFGGQLGEDQATARQISRLQGFAEWNRQHGFLDRAKEQLSTADELRKNLSSNVVEEDRKPWESMEENVKKQSENLQELVRKATNEGLNVNPAMG